MRAAALLVPLLLSCACHRAPAVPIFLWHSVGEGSGDRYDLTVDEFEQQLQLLDEYGAHPVSLSQLTDAAQGKAKLPERAVVLTFDDGRQSLFDAALPRLRAHHFTAEVFVVTGWTGEAPQSRRFFDDDTGHHPALVWPELKAMADEGVMRVQSHSATHPRFLDADAVTQRRELADSRAAIIEHLGRGADFFAYPYGSLSADSKALAEAAGYRGAVTVEAHGGGAFGVTRISVWRDSTAVVDKALRLAFGAPRPRTDQAH